MRKIKLYYEALAEDFGFAAYFFNHMAATEDNEFYMVGFMCDDDSIFLLGSESYAERDSLFQIKNEKELENSSIDWSKVICTRIEPNSHIKNSLNILEFSLNILECTDNEIFYKLGFKTGINDLYTNYMDEYQLW